MNGKYSVKKHQAIEMDASYSQESINHKKIKRNTNGSNGSKMQENVIQSTNYKFDMYKPSPEAISYLDRFASKRIQSSVSDTNSQMELRKSSDLSSMYHEVYEYEISNIDMVNTNVNDETNSFLASSVHQDFDLMNFDENTHYQSLERHQPSISSSSLPDRKKQIIVRVVTIFSIIIFLICFGMIALTLRLSAQIDEKIRRGPKLNKTKLSIDDLYRTTYNYTNLTNNYTTSYYQSSYGNGNGNNILPFTD